MPAGTASLLVATAPVYASLLAIWFLGERPTRRRWAGSAVAFAGSAVIAVSHGLGFGAAALIVLAAAVAQAIFHTAQKPLLARYTGFEVTVYAMWAGTLFIAPWTGSLVHALPHASAAAIGAAVFLGLAPSAVGFLLWAYALARMDVGRATTALCTWCPPWPSSSRWSGWARSPAPPSSSAAASPWPAWSWPAGLAGSGSAGSGLGWTRAAPVVVRSSRLRILPLGFFGSASTNTTSLGALKPARRSRQCAMHLVRGQRRRRPWARRRR